jgi:hypothetical protein
MFRPLFSAISKWRVLHGECGLRALLLSTLFHPRKHLAFRLEPLVRIVFQHPPRQVPGDRFDDVLRLAGLQQIGDDGVPQVVEP